ncbi:hypothetical protein, partial [Campylobacter sp. 1]|uniref:hypothetical protein n=1 Tax=Campylobacter sp. 1 TaxID=2039344 RepID=UPI000BD77108
MALTKETTIIRPIFESIPEELKQLPQWILWKAEPNKDKPNKLDKNPYQPNGKKAAPTRRKEWSTFQKIEQSFGTGEFDGIGFVFTEDDPYIGLDIDKEDLDNLSVIARSLTALSYTEKSPSGKGLHVILKGKLPAGANNRKT